MYHCASLEQYIENTRKVSYVVNPVLCYALDSAYLKFYRYLARK